MRRNRNSVRFCFVRGPIITANLKGALFHFTLARLELPGVAVARNILASSLSRFCFELCCCGSHSKSHNVWGLNVCDLNMKNVFNSNQRTSIGLGKFCPSKSTIFYCIFVGARLARNQIIFEIPMCVSFLRSMVISCSAHELYSRNYWPYAHRLCCAVEAFGVCSASRLLVGVFCSLSRHNPSRFWAQSEMRALQARFIHVANVCRPKGKRE